MILYLSESAGGASSKLSVNDEYLLMFENTDKLLALVSLVFKWSYTEGKKIKPFSTSSILANCEG